MATIPDTDYRTLFALSVGDRFSTYDFIVALHGFIPPRGKFSKQNIGAGGARCGVKHIALPRAAHTLNKEANSGAIAKLDYRAARSDGEAQLFDTGASGPVRTGIPG